MGKPGERGLQDKFCELQTERRAFHGKEPEGLGNVVRRAKQSFTLEE